MMTDMRRIRVFESRQWIMAFSAILLAWPVAGAEPNVNSASDQPPRKVIVGTVMRRFWGKHPGLEKRLAELTAIIDQMQAQSLSKYGRGLDLAVLPEMAVTGEGEAVGEVGDWSFPWEGPVKDAFVRAAREDHCYIVVPMYLLEDKARKRCSNAAILIDRKGETVGIYRKVHLVVDTESGSMEHGAIPGTDEPVFTCDFGKLGIQICYDMDFDRGWSELARRGAELVAWPTQSPQTSQPAFRAKQNHYFIVSSTWRNNASIFEPTGKIVSQIKEQDTQDGIKPESAKAPGDNILVQELDLSYAILPWSRTLKNGDALAQAYGNRVGYRYYQDEDRGIFWSNDPHLPIRQMLRNLGLMEEQEELKRVREIYRQAKVPGY